MVSRTAWSRSYPRQTPKVSTIIKLLVNTLLTYIIDTSCVVTRVLDSFPDVQLEFHIKVTTAASLGDAIKAAIRNIAEPVQELPGSHLPEIPADVASAAAGTAQTVGKLLVPVLKKIKPVCDAMNSISEVSDPFLRAYSRVSKVLQIRSYTTMRK